MKRLGIVAGLWLVMSGVPVWAQSVTTASARQQAEEATAKARAAAAQAQAAAQAAAAAAGRQESQNVILDFNRAFNSPAPFVQVTPYAAGGSYSVQWNTSHSNDPLAGLQVAPGTWWNNADTVTRLSLTKEQQTKMDNIFQQFRLTLIDLNAALSKEELILDPLIAAERLDEAKILTQIDRIAQARAELEKANSRMLLGIRQSLTMEQWTKIQSSPGTYRAVIRR